MAIASIPHIEVDEQGTARIAGSRIKVIHLVLEKIAYGWGPEELHEQHPHLTLAQIHAAFAYYHDHKAELDAIIEENDREVERLRAEAGESPFAKRIKGLLQARSDAASEALPLAVVGIVKDQVVVPNSALPEGARVEVVVLDYSPEIPMEAREEFEGWNLAGANNLDLVEKLALEEHKSETG